MTERAHPPDEPVEELAEEAIADNSDPQTRRETFELDLMDEDRSEEGDVVALDDIDLDDVDEHHAPHRTTR